MLDTHAERAETCITFARVPGETGPSYRALETPELSDQTRPYLKIADIPAWLTFTGIVTTYSFENLRIIVPAYPLGEY